MSQSDFEGIVKYRESKCLLLSWTTDSFITRVISFPEYYTALSHDISSFRNKHFATINKFYLRDLSVHF